MFSARILIAATAAIVFVLGGFLLFRSSDTEPAPAPVVVAPPPVVQETEEPPPEPEPTYPTVLVASRDIQPGVLLTTEMVEWREWREPLDLEFAAVKDAVELRAVLGSVSLYRIPRGAAITFDRLITPGQPSFITAVVRPGHRAVTVNVDEATTNARVIYPGDRVDVIIVLPAGMVSGIASGPVAQALVRDVRVLAVGSSSLEIGRHNRQWSGVPGVKATPPEGATFTLEVELADVERVTLGASAGRLTLAMRSITREDDRASSVSLTGFDDVLRMPPAEETLPPILPAQVRVFRGGSRSTSNEVVPRPPPAKDDEAQSPA